MAAAQAQRRSGGKVRGFRVQSCVKAKEPQSGRRRTGCEWFRVGSPCSWTAACFSSHPCPPAHRLTLQALLTLPTHLPHTSCPPGCAADQPQPPAVNNVSGIPSHFCLTLVCPTPFTPQAVLLTNPNNPPSTMYLASLHTSASHLWPNTSCPRPFC